MYVREVTFSPFWCILPANVYFILCKRVFDAFSFSYSHFIVCMIVSLLSSVLYIVGTFCVWYCHQDLFNYLDQVGFNWVF